MINKLITKLWFKQAEKNNLRFSGNEFAFQLEFILYDIAVSMFQKIEL